RRRDVREAVVHEVDVGDADTGARTYPQVRRDARCEADRRDRAAVRRLAVREPIEIEPRAEPAGDVAERERLAGEVGNLFAGTIDRRRAAEQKADGEDRAQR